MNSGVTACNLTFHRHDRQRKKFKNVATLDEKHIPRYSSSVKLHALVIKLSLSHFLQCMPKIPTESGLKYVFFNTKPGIVFFSQNVTKMIVNNSQDSRRQCNSPNQNRKINGRKK